MYSSTPVARVLSEIPADRKWRVKEREREGDRKGGVLAALAREFMDSWISRETLEALRTVWDS